MSTPGTFKVVPYASVYQSPFHHRTEWGPMLELRDSIIAHGIIHAPVVRPRPGRPEGEYEMVAGERRRRAAGEAGLTELPVMVHDLTDVEAIEWQARENMERQDLHPLDEAEYFDDLMRMGFSVEDLAKRFGRKKRDVVRSLRLLALSPSARTAYGKREIDTDAAFAIAFRIGDFTDKQDDVIAAVKSGALQVEEVPAYVLREYSAPLTDLPWLLGDNEMPGGSCVSCPKRSAVQRDLFPDPKATDRCLDVECWRRKMDSVWDRMSAEPAYTKHDADAPNLFIPQAGGRPVVMKSSGMVDAESNCPLLHGHTWEEALRKAIGKDGESPTVYLARDQDGRPRLLYKESIANKIVRKSDAGKEAERVRDAADPTRAENANNSRTEARVRRAIIDQIAARVAESDVDAWGWVVERVLELVTTRSVAGAVMQFEATDAPALVEMIREGSNRKRKQIALAMLVRETADISGELPESLLELCKIANVDVPAIERGIRKDNEDA